MIKDYNINDTITNEILYCTSKVEKTTKMGSTYYDIILQDSSGTINAKIWDMTPFIEDFDSKSFICVSGNITQFNNINQINISGCYVVDPSEVNIEDFCPKAPRPIEDMWTEFMDMVNSVKNEHLSKLLKAFFNNEVIVKRFKENSAAKTVHHAYVGGLLEHSLAVANICNTLANNYPTINRDLLITAAVLHDIGKIKEISAFPENDYTDEGNLLGHIYMGTEMIDIQIRKIEGFPKHLGDELKHCILAHHGGLEYGSPKVPALIEATALSFADDTDAKLRRFSDLLNNASDEWSERSDFFLGSKFKKTII